MNDYKALRASDGWFSRHQALWGALLGVALAGLTMLWNVSSGPLWNLNDIGGWANRRVFLIECAVCEALILCLSARMHRGSSLLLLLRQGLLALTFVMSLEAINQKTFYFTQQIEPLLNIAGERGFATAAAMESPISVPMLLLVALITQGPVYPMYTLKLLGIACYALLALLVERGAARRGADPLRRFTLLALILILPQGFLSAACAAQPEILALLLLVLAFETEPDGLSAICFGATCALCGCCLLAIPLLLRKRSSFREKGVYGLTAALAFWALLLPAVLLGVPAGRAVGSVFRALFGEPPYASGAPNLMALFPRVAMEEMPEYALLSHLPALDPVTNASPFYTADRFAVLMRSLSLAGLGLYALTMGLLWDKTSDLRTALLLTMAALFACPGASMALWLAADMLCLAAIVLAPRLRLGACAALFATAAGASYPVTQEVLLRPAPTAMLMIAAFFLIWDADRREKREAGHA